MKQMRWSELESGESYLIYTGYDWSASGYDIAEYNGNDDEIISQSNGSPMKDYVKIIYNLPNS